MSQAPAQPDARGSASTSGGASGGGIGVTLDPAQRRFFADDSRVQAVCWHRQKGKDFTTAAKAVLSSMETGESWFIVSLTQRQADATFDKCKWWAEQFKQRIGDIRSSDSEYREYDRDFDHWFTFKSRELLLPNGGRVISLPGRNPDTIAGLTGNVIFTEFGLFPNGGYDHWRVVFPLATRGFRVIAISTPRGKDSKFYELVSDPQTFSVHFCDIHQSIAEGFVLRDQHGEPCDVETFKKLYGDESGWKREYECEFIGELDPLIVWSLLELAGEHGRGKAFDALVIQGGAGWDPSFFSGVATEERRAEIGWDVARKGHLSAIWVNLGTPNLKHLRYLVLMQDCEFVLQRRVIMTLLDAQGIAVGCGDATGLGMDSNETLSARYAGRWEGVDFGGKRKSDLGSGLATAFRDQAQTLPPLDGEHKYIASDLYAVQKQVASGAGGGERDEDGKERLKLIESENPLMPESHCDIAYAGALAIRAGHVVSAEPRVTNIGGIDRSRWH